MYLVEFYYQNSSISGWLKDKSDTRFYKRFESVMECLDLAESEITLEEIAAWPEGTTSEGYKVTRICWHDE